MLGLPAPIGQIDKLALVGPADRGRYQVAILECEQRLIAGVIPKK